MTTSLAVVESGTVYPLAAYGRVEAEWDGVIGKPDVVDNALDVPGEDLIFVPQTPKSRIFTVRMVCVSATEAALNESLRQLASLVWSPSAPVLWQRTIPYNSGDETSQCYGYLTAPFRPLRPQGAGPNIAAVAFDVRMLSAYWTDVATSTAVAL